MADPAIRTRLLTAAQVCEHYGIPNPRTVSRTMRQQGLPGVRIGKTYLFDPADVEAFIAARKEVPCPAPTKAPGCAGSPDGAAITSPGTRKAANASAQQARLTSARLKQLSRHGSAHIIALPPAGRPNRPE